MEWRRFGTTGMRVPAIGLGTRRTFDVVGKEAQADRKSLVEAALNAQVALFDTSPMYGEAERVLGASLTGRRSAAIVATKVWASDERNGHDQIDRSLYYFEDRVDLYQVHNMINWQGYLPVFQRMKADGSIRASGITHHDPDAFPEMVGIMRRRLTDSIEVPYSPLQRAAETAVLPAAAEMGLGVVVMRPFGGGRLLGSAPPTGALRPFGAFGVRSWPQVILKWILSDPRVSSVIPATRRVGHLRENAAAGDPPWFGPEERAEVVRLVSKYCRLRS